MSDRISPSSTEDFDKNAAQGQKLNEMRSQLDVSPVSLAKSIGISTNTLLAIEAGLVVLSPELAKNIVVQLGVRYSDLWID